MTLNQCVKRLKSLALNHKQVKEFYFGSVLDYTDDSDRNYPACIVELKGSNISIDQTQTKYQFRIWFLDLLNISEGARENITEVKSDLTSIAEDMIAMINSPSFYSDWSLGETDNYPLNYSEEKFEDYTVAVDFDIEIGVPFLADRCQVPNISSENV